MNSKKLYHFLMNNECHLAREDENIIAWVVVNFYQLEDFVKLVGADAFEDEGVQVTLKANYLAVKLNDLIENNGEELSEYKECFNDEWNVYFDEDGNVSL